MKIIMWVEEFNFFGLACTLIGAVYTHRLFPTGNQVINITYPKGLLYFINKIQPI